MQVLLSVARLGDQHFSPAVAIDIEYVEHHAEMLACDLSLEFKHAKPRGRTNTHLHDCRPVGAPDPQRCGKRLLIADHPLDAREVDRDGVWRQDEGLQVVLESRLPLVERGIKRLALTRLGTMVVNITGCHPGDVLRGARPSLRQFARKYVGKQ
jgi:hypothetical protein